MSYNKDESFEEMFNINLNSQKNRRFILGCIGNGNMGGALIKAFGIDHYYDLHRESTCQSEIEVVEKSDTIILAVKPKNYDVLLEKLVTETNISDKTIVMIAAGYSIADAEAIIGEDKRLIRLMPNTPIMVGQGMTALACNQHVSDMEKESILDLFNKNGLAIELDEGLFPIFAALAASLPAYVFIMIEALADSAVLHGLAREDSYKIISQAILGSAKMQLESGKHPAILKDQICSPAGTTIEAVRSLESKGFRSTLIEAVNECVQKFFEL